MTVTRIDRAKMGEVRRDASTGFLSADAYLSRTGVFVYRRDDGTVRRELRHPKDVFDVESLASAEMAPVTLRHPAEMLTAETAKSAMVGSVGESVKPEGDLVAGRVSVVDAEAIAAVDGGMVELSCGYRCDIEDTSGMWGSEPYDVIQRNIRYNHVAIVEKGRAGPRVGLRLDAQDAIQIEGATRPEEAKMKVRIDGIDFDGIPDTAGQAIKKALDALDQARADTAAAIEANAAVVAEHDATKAKLDVATESLAAEKKSRADAASPEAVAKMVAERVALETTAAKFLGDTKLDGLDTVAVQKLVVLKVSPEAKDKLDAASAEYVAARFDAAVESAPEGALNGLRVDLDNASAPRTDARAEMAARNAKRGIPTAA